MKYAEMERIWVISNVMMGIRKVVMDVRIPVRLKRILTVCFRVKLRVLHVFMSVR